MATETARTNGSAYTAPAARESGTVFLLAALCLLGFLVFLLTWRER